ncbi:MAG: hypothetical protein QXI39_07835 [Candidatus Bathyarchaeia archaeon]
MKEINIFAEIKGIKYKPLLCKELNTINFNYIDTALQKDASFILKIDQNQIGLSWWVSPKRTRSYPYARVYDTLGFSGKRATIIPLIKDEGKDGDRDFLQWDTVSLMSLLGVYTIISYYIDASKSSGYRNKITDQKFDINHIKEEIKRLIDFQSDALHWNLLQLNNIREIGQRALECYKLISKKLNVEMHSWKSAERRITQFLKDKEIFMSYSRELASKAQKRERITAQPKEQLRGIKGALTIKNYLGGYYYFTCDEVEIHGKNLYLIEGKHSRTKTLPSLEDIKDGLLRMILYTNLENVEIDNKKYNPVPILKLTTSMKFDVTSLKEKERQILELLKREAIINKFRILINDEFIA